MQLNFTTDFSYLFYDTSMHSPSAKNLMLSFFAHMVFLIFNISKMEKKCEEKMMRNASQNVYGKKPLQVNNKKKKLMLLIHFQFRKFS